MKAFADIIGQTKAKAFLRRAMAGDRLAHGYLFAGPDGVGKKSMARALAAALLCTAPLDQRPCGHCGGCVKYQSGSHPDLLTIVPDGAMVKIGQVRELKKSLSFPPFASGMRVVIVEDVQTMRREAGNSLLKILEEPPPDNILLLIASDAEPVLPTIVSRCQVIPFTPMAPDETAIVLSRIYPEHTSDEIQTLVQLSGGCPGRLQDEHSGQILTLRQECIQLISTTDGGAARSVEQALELAVRMAELKEGLPTLFDMLALFFKDVMLAKLGQQVQAGGDEMDQARERWNLQQLSDMVETVDHAHLAIARNCNRGLVCEVMLLQLLPR